MKLLPLSMKGLIKLASTCLFQFSLKRRCQSSGIIKQFSSKKSSRIEEIRTSKDSIVIAFKNKNDD
jgi:hypothetical protein